MKNIVLVFVFLFFYSIPVFSQTLSWKAVSCGGSTCYGIKSDGSLWGWGVKFGYDPAQVSTVYDWVSINKGLGIRSNGTLWSMDGFYLQQIGTDSDWKDAAGNVCIKKDGSLWRWGTYYNSDGFLVQSIKPNQYLVGNDWKAIYYDNGMYFAIKSNGSLWSWGNNERGLLGLGFMSPEVYYPTQVGTDNDWIQIAGYVDASSIYGLKKNGRVVGWGYGVNCTLPEDISTCVYSFIPVSVDTASNFVKISAFKDNIYAIKSDGTLWDRGLTYYGALGDGFYGNFGNNQFEIRDYEPASPAKWVGRFQKVTDFNDWVDISAGRYFAVGLRASQPNFCSSGYNFNGELGNGWTLNQTHFVCGQNDGLGGFSTEIIDQNGLKLIPNPSNGRVTLQAKNEGVYSIYNNIGQLNRTIELNSSNNFTVVIEDLKNGIYTIKSCDSHLSFSSKKLVIVD